MEPHPCGGYFNRVADACSAKPPRVVMFVYGVRYSAGRFVTPTTNEFDIVGVHTLVQPAVAPVSEVSIVSLNFSFM